MEEQDEETIVVRAAGFQSQVLHSRGKQLEVALRRSEKELPLCPANPPCISIGSAGFCFPEVSGTRWAELQTGVDYRTRSVDAVRTLPPPLGWLEQLGWLRPRGLIRWGEGLNWTSGAPSLLKITDSREYSEQGLTNEPGLPVFDGSGVSADGSYWRYLGVSGESAYYSGVNNRTAKLFDRLLDGACWLN